MDFCKVCVSTLAETDEYFARSRFEYCPTLIEEFTAENLEKTIIEAIENEEKYNGSQVVTYDEQKEKNTSVIHDYNEVMEQLQNVGQRFAQANMMEALTEIVEDTLGAGKKVTECTKKQIDAMMIILDNLQDKAQELEI